MQANDLIFHLANANLHTFTLLAAHQLKLFETLAVRQGASFEELSKKLKIAPRPLQALLSICAANHLIEVDSDHLYQITELTRQYLLPSSPFDWRSMLDLALKNPSALSYEHAKLALSSDKAQVYGDQDLFLLNESRSDLALAFTRAMHGKSSASACHWPMRIDLTMHKCFLDIAGGSGAHAMAATKAFANISATVFERPKVSRVAQEYIDKAGLSDRINIVNGNMWTDEFPKADVHFYCDVFHDWPYDRCQLLANKSFDALPKGGRIVVHELLFNRQKTGPVSAALYNMVMLLWTEGQQLAESELTSMLKEAQFLDIQVIPTGYGDWSIVTGIKK